MKRLLRVIWLLDTVYEAPNLTIPFKVAIVIVLLATMPDEMVEGYVMIMMELAGKAMVGCNVMVAEPIELTKLF